MDGLIQYICSLWADYSFALVLSVTISYISAFITFSFFFKDSFRQLFFSWEAQGYSLLNVFFTIFVFKLAVIFNISFSSIQLNEQPFILAVVVGIAGHRILFTFFKSKDEFTNNISDDFNDFMDKIQSILFHKYAVNRHIRIRNQVTDFMREFPYENLNDLTYSCEIIARDINEKDSDDLVEKLKGILSFDISNDLKVTHVGVELSKYLGTKLIKRLASEVAQNQELDEMRNSANKMLATIRRLQQEGAE